MRLYGHNPVVGGFIPTGRNETEVNTALDAARQEVGDAIWKRGNSGSDKNGPTAIVLAKLSAIDNAPKALTGTISKVAMEETRDGSGNVYTKLRVRLDGDEGGMLSLDLGSEVAQRLVQKLEQVVPNTVITINAFATTVDRNGRQFVNHVATVKDAEGNEVKPEGSFWSKAQAAANAAAEALKSMGINDNKLINNAKTTKKVEAHKDLLIQISQRYTKAD